MATPAIDCRRLDIQVRFAEGCILQIMALAAKRQDGLGQKSVLCGEMGAVAFQAVTRRRRMGLFLLQLLLEILVAGEAEIGTLHQQELVQLRLVGAVTLRAFPRGNGKVLAFPAFHSVPQFGMALVTEFLLPGNDHPADV